MRIDKLQKETILGHGNTDLANLKRKYAMTYETLSTAATPVDLNDMQYRFDPPKLAVAREIALMREQAQQLLQAKHRAGKAIAHGAVAYWYGAAPKYVIEFPVGDENPERAEENQILHEGFSAHLDYLSSEGVVTATKADGLYVAYGTGRIIHRINEDLDADGNPRVIIYRDSDTQRLLEIESNDPKRLFAEA